MNVTIVKTYKTLSHLNDTETHLFGTLDEMAIDYKIYSHPIIFTVEEGEAFKKQIPGDHGKCLFLKDKRSNNHYLVATHIHTRPDLKALAKALDEKRFSFGKEEDMVDMIGVRPGSVTPLAIINDQDKKIHSIVLDKTLEGSNSVVFHPLRNDLSISLSFDDLVRFLKNYASNIVALAL